ncbi:MAG: hypothetical protein U0984_07560 [Prosthecobacter sp.]|nr:hypothetical protein [Prosthecobacter sp.]
MTKTKLTTKTKKIEVYFECPQCGQPNFTAKGLTGHAGKKACLNRQRERATALTAAHPELAATVARFKMFHLAAGKSAMALKLAKYFGGIEVNALYYLHAEIYGETRGGGEAAEVTLEDFVEQQLDVTARSARRYRDWFLSIAETAEHAGLVKRLNGWWSKHKPKMLGNGQAKGKGKEVMSLAELQTTMAKDLQTLLNHPDEWGLNELFEKPLKDVTPVEDEPPTAMRDAALNFWKNLFLRRIGRKDYLRLPPTVREQLGTSFKEMAFEIEETLKGRKRAGK